MKRIRFSIRLMLLLVALVAVCTVWWKAHRDVKISEWKSRTVNLKTRLAFEEMQKVKIAEELGDIKPSSPQWKHEHAKILADDLHRVETEISELHEKIDGTKPR